MSLPFDANFKTIFNDLKPLEDFPHSRVYPPRENVTEHDVISLSDPLILISVRLYVILTRNHFSLYINWSNVKLFVGILPQSA